MNRRNEIAKSIKKEIYQDIPKDIKLLLERKLGKKIVFIWDINIPIDILKYKNNIKLSDFYMVFKVFDYNYSFQVIPVFDFYLIDNKFIQSLLINKYGLGIINNILEIYKGISMKNINIKPYVIREKIRGELTKQLINYLNQLYSENIIQILEIKLPFNIDIIELENKILYLRNNKNEIRKEEINRIKNKYFNIVFVIKKNNGKVENLVIENFKLIDNYKIIKRMLEEKYGKNLIDRIIYLYRNFLKFKDKNISLIGSTKQIKVHTDYKYSSSKPFKIKYIK